ncbi:ArsR/SmtB family transcription factor [Pelagerythrobacter aerophilus]
MSDSAIEELKALAHPLRFRILEVLREGERNVGEIEDAAKIGQPALSQQLGVLRKAGLVETRKEAKLVYYRLGEEKLAGLAELVGGLAQRSGIITPARTPSPGVANFARLS